MKKRMPVSVRLLCIMYILPVRVDIIRHAGEVEGKSTCAHAALLAPRHVAVHTFPHVPDYDREQVLLIFPGPSAVSLEECLRVESGETSSGDIPKFPFTKVVFIDSTWRQTKLLYNDPRLKSLPCAVLSSHKSVFWRPQRGKPETHLATVEALYYFARDVFALLSPLAYDGRYDNLLFFFRHTHRQLRRVYGDKLGAK